MHIIHKGSNTEEGSVTRRPSRYARMLIAVIVGAALVLTSVSAASAQPAHVTLVPGAFAQGSTTATSTTSARLSLACLSSANPYDQSTSVLRSCGDVIYPLRQVTALPGGGKAYDYGVYVQYMPPPGFSILKASDSQLAEYGLPTRRELGASWYSMVKDVRRFAQPTPYLVEVPAARAATAAPSLAASRCPVPSCSFNWSGYAAYRGHSYNDVSANWVEPHFVPSPGCSTTEFGQWVGIGGLDNSKTTHLGQDGTFFAVPGFSAHQAFIETINNDLSGPVAINLTATINRKFGATTFWYSPTSRFRYFMVNDYTGIAWAGGSRRVSADLRSAEVIAEDPSTVIDGVPVPGNITDFRKFLVTGVGVAWGSHSGVHLSSLPASDVTRIVMRDSAYRLMSAPTGLTRSSNFTNVFYRCN
jgi:hypothetical protein